MKSHPILCALAACLAGCASTPSPDIAKPASEVRIYRDGEYVGSRYTVVRRVWVDSWRTAFTYPTHGSRADAIAALQTEAARYGADGLIDVVCIDQARAKLFVEPGPAIGCYGAAIRAGSGTD